MYPKAKLVSRQVNYINIPLTADDVADVTRVIVDFPADYLKEFYVEMLKGSCNAIKNIFEFIVP